MSNSGFNHNGHNLNPSEPNQQLADLLRVLRPQNTNTSSAQASFDSAPNNQFGFLQSLPLQSLVSQESSSFPAQQQQQQQQRVPDPEPITPQAFDMGTSTASYPTTMRGRVPLSANTARLVGRGMTERQQFLIFVKILLKYIDRTNNPQLRRTAKAVVAECTRRNRMGDAEYMPLQAAVERRLRTSLGEVHWARAKLCFDTYVARQGIRTINATAISAV